MIAVDGRRLCRVRRTRARPRGGVHRVRDRRRTCTTKDIDLIAKTEDEARIRAVATRTGFTFEALPMEFAGSGIEVQRFTKLVDGRSLMLDVLWLMPKLQRIRDDRERSAWENGTLSVVSREGLITLKLTAGRAQDLVDIQSLTAAEGHRDKK
jgi:hypothetical protein